METSAKQMGERASTVKVLLVCGLIGPILFIILFLIEGATRADYSPLRQPVSSLSIGELAWTQIMNFLITGSLLVAFAAGLRLVLSSSRGTTWGPLLIGLVGLGLIGSGIFVTDPLNGYPPGTPPIPVDRTVHGILHDIFGIPVFLGLPIACFVFGRYFGRISEPRWKVYSMLTGAAMFGVFFFARLGFKQMLGFEDFAGLFQRLSLIIGFTWIVLLAVKVWHLSFPSARASMVFSKWLDKQKKVDPSR
jgi:hypothetical protein